MFIDHKTRPVGTQLHLFGLLASDGRENSMKLSVYSKIIWQTCMNYHLVANYKLYIRLSYSTA